MNKLTAASNDHPFGTMLKVTNVANGKSVEVRVKGLERAACRPHYLARTNTYVY
jgi:hypothetical protein